MERYGFAGQKSGGEVAMDYLTYNLIRKVKSSQKSSTSTSSKSKTSDNNDSAIALSKPSGKITDWAKKNIYSPNPIDRTLAQTILNRSTSSSSSSTTTPPVGSLPSKEGLESKLTNLKLHSQNNILNNIKTKTTDHTNSKQSPPPVGALPNKDELESKLISTSLQGGPISQLASSVLRSNPESNIKLQLETTHQLKQNLTNEFINNLKVIQTINKNIETLKNASPTSKWIVGDKVLSRDEALAFFEKQKQAIQAQGPQNLLNFTKTFIKLSSTEQSLSNTLKTIKDYKRKGYHMKTVNNKLIFYKTPEEIQEEHYREIQQEYKNLPDWMKIARGTSSAILWGWANPSFWAGLITGGVEGGRKAIAEAEWQWIQKYRKTGKAKKQPVLTWAETYFLSPSMTNVVYPMAIGAGVSAGVGAVARVAPSVARGVSAGLKYLGYGLIGYSGYDVGKEVAQGKYKNALEKLIGYSMQFGSAHVGATSPIARVKIGETRTGQPIYKNVTPYEYGYIKASQYWTGKYPSTSYTIIKNVKVGEEGIKIIEGEHVTLGRSSLRSASITKTRFKGILKPDGTFQISKISGQIETYPLKRVGGRLKVVSNKVKITPLSATDYSAKVNQIFLDIVNGRAIIKGSLLGGGRTKVSMRFFGKPGISKVEAYLPKGKGIYRSFGIGKAGVKRFVSSSYTFAGRKTIKGLDLTTTRTKGAIFTEEGFADFINDYGVAVDLTRGSFAKAFKEFSSSTKVSGGGKQATIAMRKFIQAVQSGLASAKASATVTTPSVKPKFFVGLPGISSRAYATAYETVQEIMMYPPTAKIHTPSRPSVSPTTLIRQIERGRKGKKPPVITNIVKDMNKQNQTMLEFIRQLRKEQQENITMNQRIIDTVLREKEKERETAIIRKITASSLRSMGVAPIFPFSHTAGFAPMFRTQMFGTLGNLRKSYKAIQRGMLGYFNELRVALSLYYGERGKKKRRVRKR